MFSVFDFKTVNSRPLGLSCKL